MEKSVTTIPIRGYHLDGYGHVNNARYLELLEEARWRVYDNISKEAYSVIDWAFVIVNININYRFSATFGDEIRIETQLDNIGSKSMTFAQEIYIAGTNKLVCDAKITFVIVSKKTGKAVPIEGDLLKILTKEKSI